MGLSDFSNLCRVQHYPIHSDTDTGPDQRSDPVPLHACAALYFPVPLQQEVNSAPTFYLTNPVF